MAFTWKDAVATAFTAAVGVIGYAKLQDWNWPLLNSWRAASLIVFALGMGTCIVVGSGTGKPANDIWTAIASVLGILAVIALIAALIFGSKAMFFLLVTDIILLWASTTLHHLIAKTA